MALNTVSFVVDFLPPYKQAPADAQERKNQVERTEHLKITASKLVTPSLILPPTTKYAVAIHYCRSRGRSDSGNIIGGILDGLNTILYKDDSQVTEISYREWTGSSDWYQVTVTELAVSNR